MIDNERAFNDALARRIKELRAKRGWTIKKLAFTLGIPYETYRQYERRDKFPPYLVPRIANLLDVDVGHLLTGDRPSRPVIAEPTPASEKGGQRSSISTQKPATSKR